MHDDTDDLIDKSAYLPDGEPLLTPERAAKGDVFTGPSCAACNGSGKSREWNAPCRECRGKGWIGTVNAALLKAEDIHFAQVQVRNILNFLWEKDILTDQQHHDGQTFEVWRDMHRVALGQMRSVSSGEEEVPGVRLRAYGFVLLLKRLNRYDCRSIEMAVDTVATEHNEFFAYRDRATYRRSFIALSAAILPIHEHIRHLESLADDDRNALSEERMKIFLAEIVKCR